MIVLTNSQLNPGKISGEIEKYKYFLTNNTKLVKILTGRLVGKKLGEIDSITLRSEGFYLSGGK
jgi:hypothetical protein